jgi:arylsulfatase A-like enzyme
MEDRLSPAMIPDVTEHLHRAILTPPHHAERVTLMRTCRAFLLLAILGLLPGIAKCAEVSNRPNIILCMGDDHGWGDLGHRGHPFVKTPHLDRMAREGLRFDRWYSAAPVCSPTRGSCLTGRHPYRYGITFANAGKMLRSEITLAEILAAQGYATGHFGKWHLGTLTTKVEDANRGGPGSVEEFSPPWENGFQTCFSTESKVPTFDPMVTPTAVSREPGRKRPGEFFGTRYWTGPDTSVPVDELRGDDSQLIMDRALKFMESSASEKKPFLAVIWFHAPHNPVVADDAHRALYPDHPFALYGQHYHGCLTALDEQLGRLREELGRLGIARDTMLWYCSDNGPEHDEQTGAGTARPFRGRKRSLYEGGVRVPGVLVWPAVITSSRTTDVPCVTSDYLPTVLDVLGIDLPQRPMDGISLVPLIKGEATARNKPIGFQSEKQQSWVEDRYKLYSRDSGKSFELYDLQTDPQESRDLAAAEPERVKAMSRQLAEWVASCRRSAGGADDKVAP